LSGVCLEVRPIGWQRDTGARPTWQAEGVQPVVDHAPTHFSALFLEGDKDEMDEWLGPHGLPLHFRPGTQGLYAAEFATANGPVRIPAPDRVA
jgi:hypothetical protein